MDTWDSKGPIPRPSKGCFLEAFRYLKPTKRQPFEGTGTVMFLFGGAKTDTLFLHLFTVCFLFLRCFPASFPELECVRLFEK